MGEVDQLHDAVDHRVAEGDERVDEPELQSVQDVLEEKNRVLHKVADEDIRRGHRQEDEEPVADPGERRPVSSAG